MTRVELEKYLNKYVRITLFDGNVITGRLTECFRRGYPGGYILYQVSNKYNLYFKCSHVKKLEVL